MAVSILFYREDDDSVPTVEWLEGQERRVRTKCTARIELLAQEGHRLDRPYAAYLRSDLYELRISFGHVNYRILYFFYERTAVVLTHGLTKEDVVSPAEIDRPLRRKARFERDPESHASEW